MKPPPAVAPDPTDPVQDRSQSESPDVPGLAAWWVYFQSVPCFAFACPPDTPRPARRARASHRSDGRRLACAAGGGGPGYVTRSPATRANASFTSTSWSPKNPRSWRSRSGVLPGLRPSQARRHLLARSHRLRPPGVWWSGRALIAARFARTVDGDSQPTPLAGEGPANSAARQRVPAGRTRALATRPRLSAYAVNRLRTFAGADYMSRRTLDAPCPTR